MFVQQLADVSVTLPGALTELLVLSWEKHRQGGMWFLKHRCVCRMKGRGQRWAGRALSSALTLGQAGRKGGARAAGTSERASVGQRESLSRSGLSGGLLGKWWPGQLLWGRGAALGCPPCSRGLPDTHAAALHLHRRAGSCSPALNVPVTCRWAWHHLLPVLAPYLQAHEPCSQYWTVCCASMWSLPASTPRPAVWLPAVALFF